MQEEEIKRAIDIACRANGFAEKLHMEGFIMTFKDPFDILGFFLGYMSGPIMTESPQEYEGRHKRVVMLPEPASPTGIAL